MEKINKLSKIIDTLSSGPEFGSILLTLITLVCTVCGGGGEGVALIILCKYYFKIELKCYLK